MIDSEGGSGGIQPLLRYDGTFLVKRHRTPYP
jgi:hypothetical protein